MFFFFPALYTQQPRRSVSTRACEARHTVYSCVLSKYCCCMGIYNAAGIRSESAMTLRWLVEATHLDWRVIQTQTSILSPPLAPDLSDTFLMKSRLFPATGVHRGWRVSWNRGRWLEGDNRHVFITSTQWVDSYSLEESVTGHTLVMYHTFSPKITVWPSPSGKLSPDLPGKLAQVECHFWTDNILHWRTMVRYFNYDKCRGISQLDIKLRHIHFPNCLLKGWIKHISRLFFSTFYERLQIQCLHSCFRTVNTKVCHSVIPPEEVGKIIQYFQNIII